MHFAPQFALLACVSSTVLIDETYTDSGYEEKFMRQCSYDDSGCGKHFATTSVGGREALALKIFSTDKAFESSSSTAPRTELSEKSKTTIQPDHDYELSFDQYVEEYTDGYWFAFMQLFGASGPNIFVRWEKFSTSGKGYRLWCEQCKTDDMEFDGDMTADTNRWITWKLDFRLSDSSSGYLRLYKDGAQVQHYTGKTGGENHYFKQGIYTQHTHSAKDTRTYISNLKLLTATENMTAMIVPRMV